MTPDETESLKKSQRPEKASMENPGQPKEDNKPREVQGQSSGNNPQLEPINNQPTKQNMHNQSHKIHPSNHRILKLTLQKPLQRKLKRKAKVQRQKRHHHHPRQLRHVLRLPQRLQHRRGEEKQRQHNHTAQKQNNPRPLQINPQHMIPFRPKRLPAQCL
nr:hypothetical protein Iba_chr02bCG3020 [Ipomoea batatas]